MDPYILELTLLGLAAMGMVWIPALTKDRGISYAIVYMILGMLLYKIIPKYLPLADPQQHGTITMRFAEMVVIVSLMGTGIKLDRSFSLKNWASPLRLVTIVMLLCMAIAMLIGHTFLGLSLASAVLLGAVLAPTDPVLASEVQVGPPNEQRKSETKFAITAEAGLNDGMAFPFVWLAILMTLGKLSTGGEWLTWLGYDVIYKVASGIGIGWAFGRGVGYLLFDLSAKYKFLKTTDGFLALSLTFLVYGVTELLHGYGFFAVFICAVNLRHYEKGHEFHSELHSFTDQIERLLVAVLLILFGGSLVSGILDALTWKMALFSIGFVFIVRPLTGLLSLIKLDIDFREKLAISFFGIRGMGSVFYLAFALHEATFENQDELWSVVAFTILLSIMVHGISSTPIMKHLQATLPEEKVPE
jgi:NhaP-type Na+/H+ or K+/H+ antiporter